MSRIAMDELLRPTPDQRRKRRILRLAAAGFVVIAILATVLVSSGIRAWKKKGEPVPPAAYLVAAGNASGVRINGKIAPLETTLAVPPGAAISVPEGGGVTIVYPKNGFTQTVAGPQTIRPETPPRPDANKVDFLASPREVLVGAHYMGPRESTGRVLVTSPFGVTRFLNPTIVWEPRQGVRYDVAVVDPDDRSAPPRVAVNTLPPLRIDQLETTQERVLLADRIYNVIVREAGSDTQIGGMRFLVSPDATDAQLPLAPAALVIEAVHALWAKPARIGDAWLALSRLPADWAESELALRLRMRAAAELGLFDEMEKVRYHLHTLGRRR